MSIDSPTGILDIRNATLKVSKLEVTNATGFDTALNNIARNTILLVDSTEQTASNSWALKLPNAWVGEFEGYWASGATGDIDFNFYNNTTSGTNGYTLSMDDTTIVVKYDGVTLQTTTISSTLKTDAYRKVSILFERDTISMSIDGSRELYFKDSTLRSRVYDDEAGGYITVGGLDSTNRKFKNLKVVNEKWISDGTSNIAYMGGNVGVGVANPTSRFEVAGNETLQEYPPKAMTGYETYIEGHGVFRAGGSSDNYNSTGNSSTSGSYAEWRVFDHDRTTDSAAWLAYAGTYSSSLPTASAAKINDISGEYVYIETPHKIKLHSFNISVRNQNANESGRMPVNGIIWGKNDGDEWEQVFSWAGQVYSASDGTQITTFNVNSESPYKMHALQVTKIGSTGSNATAIGEWRLFGTPAPSSLEDGHLTLGKALTLPRVSGHAAGAETPRAESLVVHYDTTVDSVVSGTTVVDISGEGANGTLNGDAAYSSTDRALTFDGGKMVARLNNPAGAWVHSVSLWFKTPLSSSLFTIDDTNPPGGATNTTPHVVIDADGDLRWDFWSNSGTVQNNPVAANTWTHFTGTYAGGNTDDNMTIYLNGVKQSLTFNATDAPLNIAASSYVTFNDTGASISNFKLWNVALTAEEVAMEYALGRTGKAINLTDTALCLGGTVPRAQLDVRGSILIDGRLQIPGRVAFAGRKTNGNADDSNSPVIFNDMDINVDNCYDTSTGYFTAPVSGLYVYCVQFVTGSTSPNDFKIIKVSGSTATTVVHSYRTNSGVTNEPQGVNDVIVVMNAGDYIKVELVGSTTIRGNAHNFIYGYLLE